MKFLADENLPAPVIAELRVHGHDVLAVAETLAGATDTEVLLAAAADERVLLTLDRDYGDLFSIMAILRPPVWSSFGSIERTPRTTIFACCRSLMNRSGG